MNEIVAECLRGRPYPPLFIVFHCSVQCLLKSSGYSSLNAIINRQRERTLDIGGNITLQTRLPRNITTQPPYTYVCNAPRWWWRWWWWCTCVYVQRIRGTIIIMLHPCSHARFKLISYFGKRDWIWYSKRRERFGISKIGGHDPRSHSTNKFRWTLSQGTHTHGICRLHCNWETIHRHVFHFMPTNFWL